MRLNLRQKLLLGLAALSFATAFYRLLPDLNVLTGGKVARGVVVEIEDFDPIHYVAAVSFRLDGDPREGYLRLKQARFFPRVRTRQTVMVLYAAGELRLIGPQEDWPFNMLLGFLALLPAYLALRPGKKAPRQKQPPNAG
jgi:hypothetical protein